jgi:hypothetical protein
LACWGKVLARTRDVTHAGIETKFSQQRFLLSPKLFGQAEKKVRAKNLRYFHLFLRFQNSIGTIDATRARAQKFYIYYLNC